MTVTSLMREKTTFFKSLGTLRAVGPRRAYATGEAHGVVILGRPPIGPFETGSRAPFCFQTPDIEARTLRAGGKSPRPDQDFAP